MLEVLLRHADQVLSREQLLSYVWGYDYDPGSNVVDVYVGYLRKKLGQHAIVGRPASEAALGQRVALEAATMKERAERARQHRDDGDRICLKEDVQDARGCGDGIWQLGRDGQQLRARPEDGVAEIGDCLPLAWRSKLKIRTLATASSSSVATTTHEMRARRC